MKKLILIILSLVLLCFFLPILFTRKNKVQEIINKNIVQEENITRYDYGKYNVVKLLHKESGEVEEISIDEYLYGVLASEIPVSFDIEALKAQAIVARTYTIYKITEENKHENVNANICDDSNCCQAWISKEERFNKWNAEEQESNWNKILEAVDSTKGEIITYEDKPINALFHANSGGLTETATCVWGGINYPYLQTVSTVRRRKLYTISIRSNSKKGRFYIKNKRISSRFNY